jgi:hypothetical protein
LIWVLSLFIDYGCPFKFPTKISKTEAAKYCENVLEANNMKEATYKIIDEYRKNVVK